MAAFDFDTLIDRKNTNSLKYDFAVERGRPADVLPLWVADMDFQAPSCVLEALQKSVAHGIFGYSDTKADYDEAVILFTHAHVDHISAAGAVANALHIAKVYLNPADKPIYYSPGNTVGNYIPAAEDLPDTTWPPEDPRMLVLPCPGHSTGGVSYYFPEIDTVFSGDTLFFSSIGRTDLPGGSEKQLLDSVHKQLFNLPDDTRVVPGHGPFTSIGYEKKNNPYV